MTTDDKNNAGMPIENIAETLLLGSRNIDRMRKDIGDLVSMLQGMMRRLDWEEESVFSFPHPELPRIEWRYFSSTHSFLMYDEEGFKSFDSRLNQSELDINRVELIYRSLPILVNGLIKKIPGLLGNFAPFISASRVQFPDRD